MLYKSLQNITGPFIRSHDTPHGSHFIGSIHSIERNVENESQLLDKRPDIMIFIRVLWQTSPPVNTLTHSRALHLNKNRR